LEKRNSVEISLIMIKDIAGALEILRGFSEI
jgi:hypothetical protein